METESNSGRNKRIAKNTILLYARSLISVIVSLYTARVVISTLGVEDFGLYNVVGGVVAMLAFLPTGMASATQRYFSHALGQNDQNKLNEIFGVNVLIYSLIALSAILLLLTTGKWFVEYHLVVPDGKIDAVTTVYYIAVVSFATSIIQSPFMAMIVAHEDMAIYAYMAIIDALMRLAIVFLIVTIDGEKIVIYSILLLIVTLIQTGVYLIICFRKYLECRLNHIKWNRELVSEIIGFTGWTLFGQLTTVARTAAITVLLNQYFTPVVVAARAIATNIASQSNTLASQFNTSLYPPIIKAYASDQREEMHHLVINGSRITFFLMWVIALPLFVEMEQILLLWLGTVPDHAVSFARLSLLESLIFAVSLPLTTAARAPGKMAAYELILGALQLSILFVSWLLLEKGGKPETVFYTAVIVNLIMFAARLVIVGKLTGLPIIRFLNGTLPRILMVVTTSSITSYAISLRLPQDFLYSSLSVILTCIVNSAFIYVFGISKGEKQLFSAFCARFCAKLKLKISTS